MNGDISNSEVKSVVQRARKRQEKNLQGLLLLCHNLHISQHLWKQCSLTLPWRSATKCLKAHQPPLISGYCFGNYIFVSFFFFRPFLRFLRVFLFSGLMFPLPFMFLPFVQQYQARLFCCLWSAISISPDFSAVLSTPGSDLQKGRFKGYNYSGKLSYQVKEAQTGFFPWVWITK